MRKSCINFEFWPSVGPKYLSTEKKWNKKSFDVGHFCDRKANPLLGYHALCTNTLPYLKTNQTRFWTNKSQNISELASFSFNVNGRTYYWLSAEIVATFKKLPFCPQRTISVFSCRNDYIRLSCWKIWNEQCRASRKKTDILRSGWPKKA